MSTPLADTSNGPRTQENVPQKAVICCFCGASAGKSPVYLAAARSLAETLHKHNISLVYGGGTVGLMGG